jgi:2-dehydro-3-deoxy-D-arabinonate dehydratase
LVESAIEAVDPIPQPLEKLSLLVPIVAPEVWACGVTYERSRDARNYESADGKIGSTTFYDKVYDAQRPEIFLKSTAARTVGPNDKVNLRNDSNWQIPEPELGLVINGQGEILGYTIGNDMSCRDIEGENPLYLPQAKIWRNSCSIGPAILLSEDVKDPYQFEITCRIYRNGKKVVEGSANTRQLKRTFEELVSYLLKDNQIFDGTVLLTGTCIVPPNEFTLADGDQIEIEISDIGVLQNTVRLANTVVPNL